jgi:hypothetical protein
MSALICRWDEVHCPCSSQSVEHRSLVLEDSILPIPEGKHLSYWSTSRKRSKLLRGEVTSRRAYFEARLFRGEVISMRVYFDESLLR